LLPSVDAHSPTKIVFDVPSIIAPMFVLLFL
jgi:hypothetical protein